jgi:chromosomal replication initiator protein
VVLASDRPPKAISTLENRLRSRFEWGLIADIQAPNLEMRMAILQAKAAAQGVVVPDRVLERIATLVPSNVRELEGALTKVVAHASLSDTAMTAEIAETVLADMMPPKAQVEPAVVLALVAKTFGVGVADLTGNSRKKDTVQARQVAMYLLRVAMDMSFARVGELLGGKDHATAIYSVRKVSELMEEDEELQRQVGTLQEQLLMPEPISLRVRPP